MPLFDAVSTTVTSEAGPDSTPLQHAQLVASSLLCGGAACTTLGPHALPKLRHFLSTVLSVLEGPGLPPTREAALYTATAVAASLPNFLNPFLSRLLGALLTPSLLALTRDREPLVDRTLTILASQVQPRLLLPVVISMYWPCVKSGPVLVLRLARLLGQVVEAANRQAVVSHLPQLSGFFLLIMDYRRIAEPQVGKRPGMDTRADKAH